MNKETLIVGHKYIIDAEANNSGEVELVKVYGKNYCRVRDIETGIEWETMCNRLSTTKQAEKGAVSCPLCESYTIFCGSIEIDGNSQIYRDCTCGKCGKQFDNVKIKPAGGKVSRLIIMNTYYSRLVVEKEELDERRENLNNFLESDRINSIDPVQMSLLNIQSMAMLTYSQVLAERIARIGATTEQVTS
jgi:hypothetical protein